MNRILLGVMVYLRYLRSVLTHKWFVFVAARHCGVSLFRAIIHDWSKFTPAEFGPYARRFYAGNAGVLGKSNDPVEFHLAWLHHQRLNLHHWESWCQVEDFDPSHCGIRPLQMPVKYANEMVADWWAAGRGYDGAWRLPTWYWENRDKVRLHPVTRAYVEALITRTAPHLMGSQKLKVVQGG